MHSLLGRPVIAYTMDHATGSRLLTAAVLSTDSEPAKALARQVQIEVIDRPPSLATDTATVDAAARHAVEWWEAKHRKRVDIVVLLYGNIPIRAEGLIDRAIEHLIQTKADSVRSVAPVSKQHPDWLHRLEGDRMSQLRSNSIYRRQDLDPLYYHDGAAAVVTRDALFRALETPDDHQAFLGRDRRAIVQRSDEAVDIDEPVDLLIAEAILRARDQDGVPPHTSAYHHAKPVSIGRHLVGPGLPTFIVAEAGVNHGGSTETALRLVDAAAQAGADAVKFQMFRATDLVARSAATAPYQKKACGETSQQAMLSRLELPAPSFRRLKEHCDERSVTFLATPFGLQEVDQLAELGAPALKIASTDLTNAPLLQRAAASQLPIILSTGASTAEEIDRAVNSLRQADAGNRLILLHCVSCYPTPLDAVNLRAIHTLESKYGVPCGLSDHTTSTNVASWAVAAGACILEKHLTLDRTASGPDHAMSLSPAQLTEYVAAVRQTEQALGNGRPGLTESEQEVRAVAGRSVVAARDIPTGTRITSDMLTLKRPGTGISARDMDQFVDRTATVDIASDTLLSWDMVQ
jgi:N-acetylneuraminate synthase/N,N'-diacetyllegionaminate synthase